MGFSNQGLGTVLSVLKRLAEECAWLGHTSESDHINFFVDELLIILVQAGELKGIRQRRLALFHAGDDI